MTKFSAQANMTMTSAGFVSENLSELMKNRTKIVIVEDEVLFARAVIKRLQKAGFDCEHAENLNDGRALIRQFNPDFVLLDMRLPDGNGLDLLAELVTKKIDTIIMTAHGDVTDAVTAMKMGAVDYLKKPVDLEELLLIIQKNQQNAAVKNSLDFSRLRDGRAADGIQLLGNSAAIQSVREQISRIAMLSRVPDAMPPTVLITGETGTGKDVIARMLHAACANQHKPFVHVDCASLPADLIENELFGHEKGAFTNAVGARAGLIEAAEDGTLFLDEIGELPLSLQAKLLNVLERRMVRRLGSTKERAVPARIVAATNRNLHEMVALGRFRADLYYRLNVISMVLPGLRERENDALLLAKHFMQQTEKRYGLSAHTFGASAIETIQTYAWPGNVRELRHQISRAVLLCGYAQILAKDLGLQVIQNSKQPIDNKSQITLDDAEKAMLLNALEMANFNVSKAARALSITRMTMRYRMDKHRISA